MILGGVRLLILLFAVSLAIRGQALTSDASIAKALEAAVGSGGAPAGLRYLEALLVNEPENTDALFFLSAATQAVGDNQACISLIEKRAANDERLSGVLWTCYDGAGLSDKALAWARQSVGRHPGSADLHRWHGVSLMKAGDRKECVPIFERALRLSAGIDPTSLYLLAQLYRQQKDPVAALFTYLRFLTIEVDGPRSVKARDQMATLLETRVLTELGKDGTVAIAVIPIDAGPKSDPDLAALERRMGSQCGSTTRYPKPDAARMVYCAASLIGGLPESKMRPAVVEILVPFLRKVQVAKQLTGLADVVLGVDSERAKAYLTWQRSQ